MPTATAMNVPHKKPPFEEVDLFEKCVSADLARCARLQSLTIKSFAPLIWVQDKVNKRLLKAVVLLHLAGGGTHTLPMSVADEAGKAIDIRKLETLATNFLKNRRAALLPIQKKLREARLSDPKTLVAKLNEAKALEARMALRLNPGPSTNYETHFL